MIWEKLAGASAWYADVPGTGRYLVRWVRHESTYRAFLNNKRTTYAGNAPTVKKQVEDAVAALDEMERRQEVTVVFPDSLVGSGDGNRRRPPPDMEDFSNALYEQAQTYAADKKHIVLTDIYLALESVARKCAELERRVAELENGNEREKRETDGSQ